MEAFIYFVMFFLAIYCYSVGKPKKLKDGTYTDWNYEAMFKVALFVIFFAILQWFLYYEPRGY